MTLDAGSPHANPPDPEAAPGAHSIERSAKPLGRGFEQISHLFLPDSAPTRSGDPTEVDVRARVPVRPPMRTGVPVLRRGAPLTKDQLTATFRECESALEDHLRTIGSSVSCDGYGEIDLLAFDRAHRLTIIEIEVRPGDGLLLRGLGHVDWVRHNLSSIQRMCPDAMIDATRPRLCLVAPAFSRVLRSAVRQIAGPDITCFKYHEVAVSGGTGIFVERYGGDDE